MIKYINDMALEMVAGGDHEEGFDGESTGDGDDNGLAPISAPVVGIPTLITAPVGAGAIALPTLFAAVRLV